MKNKKGFILVETIIVMSVVMIALIGIYNSYITVIKKAKQKMYYDNINDVYRLNIIKKMYGNLSANYDITGETVFEKLFSNVELNSSISIIYFESSSNIESNEYSNSFKRYLQTTNYSNKNLLILNYIDIDGKEHYASLEV